MCIIAKQFIEWWCYTAQKMKALICSFKKSHKNNELKHSNLNVYCVIIFVFRIRKIGFCYKKRE